MREGAVKILDLLQKLSLMSSLKVLFIDLILNQRIGFGGKE